MSDMNIATAKNVFVSKIPPSPATSQRGTVIKHIGKSGTNV